MDQDVRWRQRFTNYLKALSLLEKFVEKGDGLNELEEQGLIKSLMIIPLRTHNSYMKQLL